MFLKILKHDWSLRAAQERGRRVASRQKAVRLFYPKSIFVWNFPFYIPYRGKERFSSTPLQRVFVVCVCVFFFFYLGKSIQSFVLCPSFALSAYCWFDPLEIKRLSESRSVAGRGKIGTEAERYCRCTHAEERSGAFDSVGCDELILFYFFAVAAAAAMLKQNPSASVWQSERADGFVCCNTPPQKAHTGSWCCVLYGMQSI